MSEATSDQIGDLLAYLHRKDSDRAHFMTDPQVTTERPYGFGSPIPEFSTAQLLSIALTAQKLGQLIGVEDEIQNPGVAVHPLACCSGGGCKTKTSFVVDADNALATVAVLAALTRAAVSEGSLAVADTLQVVIEHICERASGNGTLKISMYFVLDEDKFAHFPASVPLLNEALIGLIGLLAGNAAYAGVIADIQGRQIALLGAS
ncbi:MAG: hypothetical protein C0434_02965 [Xanthomonadaceae bacterium]|nr:hypothetical protein [Xanthomonadaceae bacterium]